MIQAAESDVAANKGLGGAIATGLFLFVVDSFIFGMPGLGVIGTIIPLLWLIPATVAAWKRADLFRLRSLKLLIYAATLVGIIALFAGNSYLARTRADRIVSAVQDYNGKNHRYPTSLQDLVPEYIDAIPRARYTLMHGGFYYPRGNVDDPSLMYYSYPPFARRIYHFQDRKWILID